MVLTSVSKKKDMIATIIAVILAALVVAFFVYMSYTVHR